MNLTVPNSLGVLVALAVLVVAIVLLVQQGFGWALALCAALAVARLT